MVRNCFLCPLYVVNVDHALLLAGAYDVSYLSTLTDLENEELLGKVVVLQGCDEPPEEWRQLALPFMQTEGLFMTHKPFPSPQRRPGPVHLVGLNHNVTTTGGLISPQSETEPSVSQSSQGPGKPIDPTKVSHRQSIVLTVSTDIQYSTISHCTNVCNDPSILCSLSIIIVINLCSRDPSTMQ